VAHRQGRPAETPVTVAIPYSSEQASTIRAHCASLAGGTSISLRNNVTGLDDRNTALLITAIRHAAGERT